MIASSAGWKPKKEYKRVPCALDNGAFQCWRRGFPFMADVFRETLAESYRVGLTLDFIVCPDIVSGGKDSLSYSMKWANGELETAKNLALAVQDGMTVQDVRPYLHRFAWLFVGGTLDWKWQTAKQWIDLAHSRGLKCHIGRVGTLPHLKQAQRLGADSVDSTSFARNDSWHIIEEFQDARQLDLVA
ncbi:MAG: hypothetical protein CMH65_06555 [Nevskiales bacterium]|nr:hypothetical protein [Nevskiales bacterium]